MPPLHIAEPQNADGEVRALDPDGGPAPKILVVDDNADAADALGALLREFGHEVLVVYGPVEALAAAVGFAPDIAILDIGLLVMDGYELAQALRKRLGRKRVAIPS